MFNEAIKNIVLSATAEAPAADTAVKTAESFSETITEGAYVAIVGIGIVFLILALLWAVLELFKLFFYILPNKKAAKATEASKSEPAKATEAAADLSAATEAPASQTDGGSLIAAITAAIAAYRASEGSSTYTGGFRVVSFKRK